MRPKQQYLEREGGEKRLHHMTLGRPLKQSERREANKKQGTRNQETFRVFSGPKEVDGRKKKPSKSEVEPP